MTPTAEPSVDELKRLCDDLIENPGTDKGFWVSNIRTIARALRSRLSHPTLSADRLAEIQKRHDADVALAEAHMPGKPITEQRFLDRAELLAALKHP